MMEWMKSMEGGEMRLALAQMDTRLGDIEGICSRVFDQADDSVIAWGAPYVRSGAAYRRDSAHFAHRVW